MKNILSRLFQNLKRKTPAVSLTTEPTLSAVDPRQMVIREIKAHQLETGKISAAQVRVAAVLFFNVQVCSSFYTLRNYSKYGQYFEISSVKLEWSENGEDLIDMFFTFSDTSFDSSVKITISVKDLSEWMTAVTPPMLDQPKSMV